MSSNNEKEYECVAIFDASLNDQAVSSQVEAFEELLKSRGGVLERKDIWGKRELAYPIKKKQFGIYAIFVFKGDNAIVSYLERQLKLNERVIRALIVKKDHLAPDWIQRPMEEESQSADLPDLSGAPNRNGDENLEQAGELIA